MRSIEKSICVALTVFIIPCIAVIENWALNVTVHQQSFFSQGGQDGSIDYIFSKIGTTNKYFVEFGFNVPSYEDPRSTGSNSRFLYENGWRGLLLDADFENSTINLQKEFITPQTSISSLKNTTSQKRSTTYPST